MSKAYEDKLCGLCGERYSPTSSNQSRCSDCPRACSGLGAEGHDPLCSGSGAWGAYLSKECANKRNRNRYHQNLQKSRLRVSASVLEWRLRHPEEARAASDRWALKNPTKVGESSRRRRQRRRARILLAAIGAGLPWPSIDDLLVIYLGLCWDCGRQYPHPAPSREWPVDHLIPLTKGGPHSAENAAPHCPSCSPRKGNRIRLKDLIQYSLRCAQLGVPETWPVEDHL